MTKITWIRPLHYGKIAWKSAGHESRLKRGLKIFKFSSTRENNDQEHRQKSLVLALLAGIGFTLLPKNAFI
jgi:hypothetical protein